MLGGNLGSLLYGDVSVMLSMSGTESQQSSLNMGSDGVLNSTCIIIRAARFHNLDRRSICVDAAEPHVTDP